MGTISLTNALFSKVQQRVLGLIFGQSNRVFYTKEIIRLSFSGSGAVQRELAKLTSAGLITAKQRGNQKLYQANAQSPVFSELKSIIIKTFGLADVLHETLQPLADRIRITLVYGSIARQEDTANSDIDLMLISDLSYADLYPILEKAEERLGRTINPTCYSVSEWVKKQNNHFVTQVLNQPKIFIIGSEDELRELSENGKT